MKYHVRICKKCGVKRYIYEDELTKDYRNYHCSKGHVWHVKRAVLDKIIELELANLRPKIEGLFDRDDIFYKELRHRVKF